MRTFQCDEHVGRAAVERESQGGRIASRPVIRIALLTARRKDPPGGGLASYKTMTANERATNRPVD